VMGRLTVEVRAVDNFSGVSHVDFSLDDRLMITDDTAQNNTYSWEWVERGFFFPYHLKATAYDRAGNSASKQIIVWKIL
jgi:hypothetical protein